MEFKDQLIEITNKAIKEQLLREEEEANHRASHDVRTLTPEERRWMEVNEIIGDISFTCLSEAQEGKNKAEILDLNRNASWLTPSDFISITDEHGKVMRGRQPWVLKVEDAIRSLGLTPEYGDDKDDFGVWSREFLSAKWE